MNIVQLRMPRVLVLSIACVVVAVPLLWYCCGDQIALVSQVVYYNYYGPNGETSDTRLVSSDVRINSIAFVVSTGFSDSQMRFSVHVRMPPFHPVTSSRL